MFLHTPGMGSREKKKKRIQGKMRIQSLCFPPGIHPELSLGFILVELSQIWADPSRAAPALTPLKQIYGCFWRPLGGLVWPQVAQGWPGPSWCLHGILELHKSGNSLLHHKKKLGYFYVQIIELFEFFMPWVGKGRGGLVLLALVAPLRSLAGPGEFPSCLECPGGKLENSR